MPISLNSIGYSARNSIEKSDIFGAHKRDKEETDASKDSDGVKIEISAEGRKQVQNHTSNSNMITVNDNKVTVSDSYRNDIKNISDKFWVEEDGTVRASMKASKGNRFFAEYDKQVRDDLNFWIRMTFDPTFLSMEYSPNDVRGRLADAGVKTGFFTVTIGDCSATQFLTQGKNAVAVYSKEQYDQRYNNHIMNGRISRNYKSGDVFTIAGKEYTVDNNGKLDVPYGEDIWDVEYPKIRGEEIKD